MDEEAIKVFATQNGLEGRTYEQLSQEPKVIAEFQKAVDQLNQGLASFETIKRFALLPRDFTVEGGELTPSLKVKRKEVEKAYAHLLDDFYADSMAQV